MKFFFFSNINIYYLSLIITTFSILFIWRDKNVINYCPSTYKILATGSSDNHFHLLLLFLYRIYIVENKICVIVWDLGLSQPNNILLCNAKKYIEKKSITLHIKKFNYNIYPKHFNISLHAGYYSWKPFVIYSTYNQYRRSILWLDCGCYIHKKLDFEYNEIKRKKIWSIGQSTTIKRYTHNGLLNILNVNKTLYNKIMCAGGIVGFYYPSNITYYILSLWKACALIKNCISPIGANRANHRQDQSVLSILLYENNFDCSKNKHVGFSEHFDKAYRKYNDILYSKFILQISSNKYNKNSFSYIY